MKLAGGYDFIGSCVPDAFLFPNGMLIDFSEIRAPIFSGCRVMVWDREFLRNA